MVSSSTKDSYVCRLSFEVSGLAQNHAKAPRNSRDRRYFENVVMFMMVSSGAK